jgi:hypothetical protein
MELLDLKTVGKQRMMEITNDIVNSVESGSISALEAVVMMKTYLKAIEQAESILKPAVIDAIAKYGKTAKLLGCELSTMEAGTRYDYTNCGDNVLNTLNEQKKELDVQIKERETMLKGLPTNGIETVTEDGEVIKLFPPQKTSTSTFKFSFSK